MHSDPEKRREYQRQYLKQYNARPEVRERNKRWREENAERLKEYRQQRAEARREASRRCAERHKDDPDRKQRKKEYMRQYAQKNREHLRERARQYAVKNREKIRANARAWKAAHREELNAANRDYYRKNKAKVDAKNRKYAVEHPETTREACRVWRKNNPEKMSELCESWRKRNPEKVAEARRRWRSKPETKELLYEINKRYREGPSYAASKEAYAEKRRDIARAARERHRELINEYQRLYCGTYPRRTAIYAKLAQCGGLCYICGLSLVVDDVEIDHVIPKTKGGTNDIDNLMPVHRLCNVRKGNKLNYPVARADLIILASGVKAHPRKRSRKWQDRGVVEATGGNRG